MNVWCKWFPKLLRQSFDVLLFWILDPLAWTGHDVAHLSGIQNKQSPRILQSHRRITNHAFTCAHHMVMPLKSETPNSIISLSILIIIIRIIKHHQTSWSSIKYHQTSSKSVYQLISVFEITIDTLYSSSSHLGRCNFWWLWSPLDKKTAGQWQLGRWDTILCPLTLGGSTIAGWFIMVYNGQSYSDRWFRATPVSGTSNWIQLTVCVEPMVILGSECWWIVGWFAGDFSGYCWIQNCWGQNLVELKCWKWPVHHFQPQTDVDFVGLRWWVHRLNYATSVVFDGHTEKISCHSAWFMRRGTDRSRIGLVRTENQLQTTRSKDLGTSSTICHDQCISL